MRISSLHPLRHPPSTLSLPLALHQVSAGFPSPADGYIERSLDLNELVIRNPHATFFVHVHGDSMINAGIRSGAILIIDRSVQPKSNDIVLVVLYGEFTVKRWVETEHSIVLVAENDQFPDIPVEPEMELQVWGVVTYTLHCLSSC